MESFSYSRHKIEAEYIYMNELIVESFGFVKPQRSEFVEKDDLETI